MPTTQKETAPDRRLIERKMRRGKLTRKEHEKFLATLPDVAHKGMQMAAPEEDDLDDELDDDEVEDEGDEEEE